MESLAPNGVIVETSNDPPNVKLDLAGAGLGLALTTRFQALSTSLSDVVFLPTAAPELTMSIGLVWRKKDVSSTLRQFIKVVKELYEAGQFRP
jgi:DNA-binding transcriptional LysR family regulator